MKLLIPILSQTTVKIILWSALVLLLLVPAGVMAQSNTNSITSQSSSEPDNTSKANKAKEAKSHTGEAIAMTSIVMGLALPMLWVWCDYQKRKMLLTLCHQERLAALEKGLELPSFPPEAFEATNVSAKEGCGKDTSLISGLVWIAIAVGAGIFLYYSPRPFVHPTVAAIPLGIGLAYLICYGLEFKNRGTSCSERS